MGMETAAVAAVHNRKTKGGDVKITLKSEKVDAEAPTKSEEL